MASYNAPGVYIEDLLGGTPSMNTGSGVIAGFIGVCTTAPEKAAVITGMAEFKSKFTLPTGSFLGDSVQAYFDNGGSVCVVCGIVPKDKLTTDDIKAALVKFEHADSVINVIALPGISDTTIQLTVHDWCEKSRSCFAIFDTDKEAITLDILQPIYQNYKWGYAAVYSPWLVTTDGNTVPPSGAVAGIYARSDNTVGVWKAPANEPVKGVKDLYHTWSVADQEVLNPAGINLIRSFRGQGILVWGARTLNHTDPDWKYINVRRLFIYIEDCIKNSVSWAVFEPNTEVLWSRIRSMITAFLNDLRHKGAMAGDSAEEAFFVKIDRSTMTDADITNGTLICEIGVAPSRPAEFVVFKIAQKTAEAS